MKRSLTMSLLAVSMTGLTACQSFPLTSWMFKRPAPATAAAAAPDSDALRALAEGRQAIRDNRLAAAVLPLKLALLDPATRPEASNALGVTYARMGREDLAEKYFKSAMAADPRDRRFADNLTRLRAEVLARKARAGEARLAQQSADPRTGTFAMPAAPAGREDNGGSRLAGTAERRSRSEVFIASAGTASAPVATVAFATPAKGAEKAAPAAARASSAAAPKPAAAPRPVRPQVIYIPFDEPAQGGASRKDRP